MIFRLLIIACLTGILSQNVSASNPELVPVDYGYAEQPTVGGHKWTGGDYFVAIMLPLAIASLFILPQIFDGEYRQWPVQKFGVFNKNEQAKKRYKFPTVQR